MASNYIPLCDPYIWEDPRYIFRSLWLSRQHDRSRGACASELVNNIFVVYLVALLVGLATTPFTRVYNMPLIMGLLATIYLIPVFIHLSNIARMRKHVAAVHEGFVEQPTPGGFNSVTVAPAPPQPSGVSANPFNNVLINELKYSPDRLAAPDITSHQAKIAMDDFFRVQWYSDPTDVFGKAQSQRQFVTQPSTTIPNDQGSYQDWLYKIPGKTCKEGNAEACYGASNAGILPWLDWTSNKHSPSL